MRLKHKSILILISVMLITALIGCARYATSDQKISALESKVSIGVSEIEFTESIPKAQLLDEKEDIKIYGIRVSETCFICGSSKGFQQSFESYATQFTIENGTLVSFNRILNGASIADRY